MAADQEEESTATTAAGKGGSSSSCSPSRTRETAAIASTDPRPRRNQEQHHGAGGTKKRPIEARAAHVLTLAHGRRGMGELGGDSICCWVFLCRSSCRDCWNAERDWTGGDVSGAASDQKKAPFWFLLDVKAGTRHPAVNCCNLELG
jgi:hypothetical protein